MNKRSAVLTILAVSVILAFSVGCSGGQGGGTNGSGAYPSGGSNGAAGRTTVVEEGLAFDPASLEVEVGDTVTFENQDSASHNVQIDGAELGMQNQGETKTWTASKAGSFPYNCTIHPSMTGEITVK